MRVHRHDMLSRAAVQPGAFRNHPTKHDGMSTNWEKYATAEDTRRQGRQAPTEYAVIQMVVEEILQIPQQSVEHTPDVENDNRAHTDVFGPKDARTRVEFMRRYRIEIVLDESVS
jgi:hypothetical protein